MSSSDFARCVIPSVSGALYIHHPSRMLFPFWSDVHLHAPKLSGAEVPVTALGRTVGMTLS
jgi:hypothetical protein